MLSSLPPASTARDNKRERGRAFLRFPHILSIGGYFPCRAPPLASLFLSLFRLREMREVREEETRKNDGKSRVIHGGRGTGTIWTGGNEGRVNERVA